MAQSTNALPPDRTRAPHRDWRNRRVTIMGLGRHGGGVAATRYLARQGASVTVSDMADEAALDDSLAALNGVPLAACHLGSHHEADFDTDFVVVNPAVRPDHPCLQIARRAGARLISETELFLSSCPARMIGVTGSNGKSTTVSMLAAIFRAAKRRAWVGGNIGRSLLGDLDRIAPDDWVVLELSSFQLAHLSESVRLPEIAVITNWSPNHLDWHGTYDAYARAKQRLLVRQRVGDTAVVNPRDSATADWAALAVGRVEQAWPIEWLPELAVPGDHNRENAACAAAAAAAAGVDRDAIERALAAFAGLDHRLQFLGQWDGRRFYNDSKSTSPGAAIAALAALDGPVWLLAGGTSKGVPLDELARAVVHRARGAALFGAVRGALAAAIREHDVDFELLATQSMGDALAWCWRRSRRGDAILLSPASASFDQFRDFADRGEKFRALVNELPRAR